MSQHLTSSYSSPGNVLLSDFKLIHVYVTPTLVTQVDFTAIPIRVIIEFW